mmetsp:Transcript_26189/g.77747  ORF Transcript_26189/g.77747 Transcript_26189/m.77747 type:complete len:231 (-) Transcript_26189:733-1425(-)
MAATAAASTRIGAQPRPSPLLPPLVLLLMLGLLAHMSRVHADPRANANALDFTNFDLIAGTWTGKCTQTAYINPGEAGGAMSCGMSLDEVFVYDFSVTFGANNAYSMSSGVFLTTGQNVSFTEARVNQTYVPLSGSGTVSLVDIGRGGTKCATVNWASGGSGQSKALMTLVKGVPSNHITYLEEGVRVGPRLGGSSVDCPWVTNDVNYCDEDAQMYSYTCQAFVTLSMYL